MTQTQLILGLKPAIIYLVSLKYYEVGCRLGWGGHGVRQHLQRSMSECIRVEWMGSLGRVWVGRGAVVGMYKLQFTGHNIVNTDHNVGFYFEFVSRTRVRV